jgi:hypothetical protein
MAIKPQDLPNFGVTDGNFVPTGDSGIIVPKAADPNGPLDQLETKDQMEQRLEKVVVRPDVSEIEPEKPKPSLTNLVEQNPDWEPNYRFRLGIAKDMLKLTENEIEVTVKEITHLSILLDVHPLWASVDDIQMLRKKLRYVHNLGHEKRTHQTEVTVTQEMIEREDEKARQRLAALKDKPGFIKRFAKAWANT